MSSTIVLPGATRVVKLTPNNSFIPSTIQSIDNVFDVSLLSGAKFASWRALATTADKVGVIEDGIKESSRFIDSNYNISTPEGNLWFLGKSAQNHPYYLQTGTSLSKSNSASVFDSQHNSYGFEEVSGNILDRCGLNNGVPNGDVAYQVSGMIGKCVQLGPTNGSRFILNFMNHLGDQEKMTLIGIFSSTGQVDFFKWGFVRIANSSGVLSCMFRSDEFYIGMAPLTSSLTVVAAVWDGTASIPSDKIKIYTNGVLCTVPIIENHGTSTTTESAVTFGDIGPLTAAPNNMKADEFRIYKEALTQDQITILTNQWLNSATFWTPTVQPIITNVDNLGSNRWQINGTGFKPESADPTGTVNGIACTVESASDTVVTIEEGVGTPQINKLIALTNSDSEIVNYLTNYPYNNRFSNTPFSFGF